MMMVTKLEKAVEVGDEDDEVGHEDDEVGHEDDEVGDELKMMNLRIRTHDEVGDKVDEVGVEDVGELQVSFPMILLLVR